MRQAVPMPRATIPLGDQGGGGGEKGRRGEEGWRKRVGERRRKDSCISNCVIIYLKTHQYTNIPTWSVDHSYLFPLDIIKAHITLLYTL
jgi:hypothetical protein